MMSAQIFAFLPELVLLLGALALFFVALGDGRTSLARKVAFATAIAAILASIFSLNRVFTLNLETTLFDGAYRVDLFSQSLKFVFACGLGIILLLSGTLEDVRA